MRITSGAYRGREVRSPEVAGTHPMGERERLALFNTLVSLRGPLGGERQDAPTLEQDTPTPHQLAVLDAYAGSGMLGIEALSRGADYVVFVEKAPGVARVIRENLAKLGVPAAQTQVICADVNKMSLIDKFDIILADPPYDKFDASEVEKLTRYLKNGGVLVLSHPGVAPELNGLTLEKTSAYARAHLTFYTK